MSNIQKEFLEATVRVNSLKNKPSNDILLELYGLYKQATIGDINTPIPPFWDVKSRAKWDGWNFYKTTPKEKAMKSYIRLVKRLER